MVTRSWLLTGFWCVGEMEKAEDMLQHLEREELAREMLIELVEEGEVPK